MDCMRVMVLFNPISGRGRGAAAAQELAAALTTAGHVAVCTPTRMEPAESWLDPVLRDVELAVIVGGDGAVRMAGAAAARTNTPIYHYPCGTENLFAREFRMDRVPATLLRAIVRCRVQRIDIATANGRVFLLMLSIGIDAEVVHDLASTRGRSISHWTYLRPMVRQFLQWKPRSMRIDVDGQRVVDGLPGFVIVANSRQYGWRFNPAGRASMSDGLLDVVFFPARGRLELLHWALTCRMQRHLDHPRLMYRTGREVIIASDRAMKYQLDGDPPEAVEGECAADEDGWSLNATIRPGVLPVLVPE